jgi:hypothetical protein
MHSNSNNNPPYRQQFPVNLGVGANSYLSASLGGVSPSDGFPSFQNEQQSPFGNADFSASQRRQQRQQEIISDMEKAAKNGDHEMLAKIVEEGMMSPDVTEASSARHITNDGATEGGISSSQQSKLITRKDLNRALILVV